ncbi:CBS domain-containing protein [bacterium]|nr:CBS domain-containing protein [bacterium]
MGEMFERSSGDSETLRRFTRYLLNDVHALEKMLETGMIESGVRRIGAEQEFALIDKNWQPASIGPELLERMNDPAFTAEIARFNIEANLDPLPFGGTCLREMETHLNKVVDRARTAAQEMDSNIALTGILPTIRKSHLTLDNMTPRERYYMLNEMFARLLGEGGAYELKIEGIDELTLTHDNVMLEACNTSFQVHFQVDPEIFPQRYNLAQAVTAPVLAAAVNSPLLGRFRLWRETRIALFQQSIDTRKGPFERQLQPRVSFGTRWVDKSVLEIFQEDIARYKVLFALDDAEDPFEAIEAGRAPKLEALRLHTGTVYRWNRACYGISDGKPHLRIENRVLPAGPTVVDEVANAAFWFGLMAGLEGEYDDITQVMEFDHARENFYAAARHGLDARFTWINGAKVTAHDLILKELLPLAREGLLNRGIDKDDVSRYLDIIRDRVKSDMTGSQWALKSLGSIKQSGGTRWEQINALVAATVKRQTEGKPVHEWPLARLDEAGGWKQNYLTVNQLMTTDIYTVSPDEPLDLVANLMVWHKVRHVMVEDADHHLMGLVSHRHLLKLTGRELPKQDGHTAPVSDFMVTEPITVTPDTKTIDAIHMMRENRISCLPVLKDERLVGVISEDDFMVMAGMLLEENLKD